MSRLQGWYDVEGRDGPKLVIIFSFPVVTSNLNEELYKNGNFCNNNWLIIIIIKL